ncbi:MAG: DEAD/DEAH box helicase [Nanoarchaeota archaeon]|nr:DEAD/DEAH box helicase [Nanoarchaeota archaeon]
MSFEKLNVNIEIVKGLKEMGITSPTEIQQKAIPIVLTGKHLIGGSKTGSGKTAAFGIPLVQMIKPKQGLQALILAPVRELAVQISEELKKFGKHLNFSVTTVYGGVGYQPQIDGMRNSEIVVATPGRMLDHLQSGNVDLSKIKFFVLDEADKMVEMGFIEDVEKIMSQTPKNRQILLFGATISHEIEQIKKRYMPDSVSVEAERHVQEDFLEQYFCDLRPHEKFSYLVNTLKKEKSEKVIIFCSTRTTVELIGHNLKKQGIKNAMIHGKLTQSRRLSVIDDFNKGKIDIMIASAVAARGIDIKFVSHVINYDLSQDPQEYVHRVGRTARAGEKGKAITLLSDKDYGTFNQILDRYSNLNIEEVQKGEFPKLTFETRMERRPRSFGQVGRGRYSNARNGSHRSGGSRFPSHSGNQRGSNFY